MLDLTDEQMNAAMLAILAGATTPADAGLPTGAEAKAFFKTLVAQMQDIADRGLVIDMVNTGYDEPDAA